MRTHGVPNFPDPSKGSGGGEGFAVSATPGSPTITVDGTTFSGPAFEAADKACKFFPAGGPPAISAADQAAMIAKARCIRRHGVPNFPDPTFGPRGKGAGVTLPAGLNMNSPAFRHAVKTCANVGKGIPGSATG